MSKTVALNNKFRLGRSFLLVNSTNSLMTLCFADEFTRLKEAKMNVFRSILLMLACLVANQTASACCLFPWFPAFAGYGGGWGGYAPPAYASMNYAPSYGYAAPMSYASYGVSDYGMQSVGYAGVFSGASAGCCVTNACATNCCSSGCGSVGCGTAGCSDCVSTETRKEPTPDPGFPGETERERLERRLRELDRLEYEDRDAPRNDDGRYPPRTDDRNETDGFTRPGSRDDSGLGGSGSSGRGGWAPGRDSTDPADDLDANPLPPFDPSRFGPDSRQKPVVPEDDATGSGVIDRGANKPPINVPIEETPEPTEGESAPGTEAGPREFLPDEGDEQARRPHSFLTQRESRSSHFGVVSLKRLAGDAPSQPQRTTKMSSARKANAPLQWISLPAPLGRTRS